MKRKEYEKPAMQVFELKQRPTLLAGSMGDRDNYEETTDNPFAG